MGTKNQVSQQVGNTFNKYKFYGEFATVLKWLLKKVI